MVSNKHKLTGWKQYSMSLKSGSFYRKKYFLKHDDKVKIRKQYRSATKVWIWMCLRLWIIKLTAVTEQEVRSESKRCRCQCCLGLRGRTSQQSDGQQNPLIKQSAEQQRTEAQDRAGLGRAQRQTEPKTNNTGTLSPFVRVKNKTPPVPVDLKMYVVHLHFVRCTFSLVQTHQTMKFKSVMTNV